MQSNLVYVGSYTSAEQPVGITVFRRDPGSGSLTRLHEVEALSPSWLAFSPDRRFLYSVNETTEFDRKESGAVSSYAIDQTTGELTFLSTQMSEGGAPCHLCTDPGGRLLFVANHEHGTIATFPINEGGTVEPASDVQQHEGLGPGPTQTSPHAHFVTFDPPGERLMAVDKGIDKVVIYRVDYQAKKLVPADPPYAMLHRGAAPRHLAFHPSGNFVYVNGEADMTITAFSYDADQGVMSEIEYDPTLPSGASRDGVSTAGIIMHPSGRFVYVSNRGHDSIAIFAIDQETGRLGLIGHESSGGNTPRGFEIDPEGNFMYVGNQNSDTIVIFQIDKDSGELQSTGEVVDCSAPVAFIFS